MSCQSINNRYTAQIVDGGALLPETRLLLSQWERHISIEDNLRRAQVENTLGKASRNRVSRILDAFRRRYTQDPDLLHALVLLAKADALQVTLDRILCFCALQDDPLLTDTALCLLVPAYRAGRSDITVAEVADWLGQQCSAGRTAGRWSPSTITRLASGLLSTLRDFGLLEGTVKKQMCPVFMPAEACALMSFFLYRDLSSGELVVNNQAWEAFYMTPFDVERSLIEASGLKLLQYNAAGRVIRIDYPAQSAEEYARVITERKA